MPEAMSLTATARRPVKAGDLRPNISGGRGDELLHRRFAQSRDPMLREQLVHRYLPLARYAAGQYARGNEPFDDLMQVASVGLLKAIDRFDPDNGAAFSSYALPTMTGELRRHFRDRGWAIRPPRDLQEQALLVERATDELRRETGRSPAIDDIAQHTGLSAEAVLEAREALSARTAASLSAPTGHDDDEDFGIESRFGVDDGGFDAVEARTTIEAMTRVLTAREREIIRLRFEEDLTQAEIGELVGLSQMHISRMLRTAIQRLHAYAAGTP
jgi:RNA polymerase sigma-B factor